MGTVKNIASIIYGCILGNWLETVYKTLTHRPGGEHRFVVLALTTPGYVRVIETDDESVALDFADRIDADTQSLTGFVFDRLCPGDKSELADIDIMDQVPADAEDREQLLKFIREARKYY